MDVQAATMAVPEASIGFLLGSLLLLLAVASMQHRLDVLGRRVDALEAVLRRGKRR